jgi:hypothetical protein
MVPPTPLDPASAASINTIEASRRMSRSAAQRTGRGASVCIAARVPNSPSVNVLGLIRRGPTPLSVACIALHSKGDGKAAHRAYRVACSRNIVGLE